MKNEKMEALSLAKKILNNEVDLIDGVILLGQAVRRIDDDIRYSEDFVLFDGLESELDTVPIGDLVEKYSAEYLVRAYKKAGQYIYPDRKIIYESCKNIIKELEKNPD